MSLVKCIELKQRLDPSMMRACAKLGIWYIGVWVRLPSILLWPGFHVRVFFLLVHHAISD